MNILFSSNKSPIFTADIPVRWCDLDPIGHVNNAVYMTYLEEARVQFGKKIGLGFDPCMVPVIVSSENHYRLPIKWPAHLHIQLFIQRLGRTSATFGHRIIDAVNSEKLYCEGHVITVWFNSIKGKPTEVPSQLKELVKEEPPMAPVESR